MAFLAAWVQLLWLVAWVERPQRVLKFGSHDICCRLEHVAVDGEIEDPPLEPRLLIFQHLLASKRGELAWLATDAALLLSTSKDALSYRCEKSNLLSGAETRGVVAALVVVFRDVKRLFLFLLTKKASGATAIKVDWQLIGGARVG